jgi:FkbM family methyltransferase
LAKLETRNSKPERNPKETRKKLETRNPKSEGNSKPTNPKSNRTAPVPIRVWSIEVSFEFRISSFAFHNPMFTHLIQPALHLALRLLAPRPDAAPYPDWHLSAGVSYRVRSYRWRRALMRRIKPGARFVYTWLDGVRVWIDPASEMPRFLYLTGRYEPCETGFLRSQLQRIGSGSSSGGGSGGGGDSGGGGAVVIDVGANAGLYTLLAAAGVGEAGKVIAVEPSPRERQALRDNLDLNPRLARRVRIIPAALHDHAGEADLLVATAANSGHNTLGAFCYDHTVLHERRAVPLRRLDDIVAEHRLTRVDLIKMDVEGAEWFALRGAEQTLRRYQPALILELSDAALECQGCTRSQVVTFLRDLGYAFRHFATADGRPSDALAAPPAAVASVIAQPSAAAAHPIAVAA